jgi:hypothetical protein
LARHERPARWVGGALFRGRDRSPGDGVGAPDDDALGVWQRRVQRTRVGAVIRYERLAAVAIAAGVLFVGCSGSGRPAVRANPVPRVTPRTVIVTLPPTANPTATPEPTAKPTPKPTPNAREHAAAQRAARERRERRDRREARERRERRERERNYVSGYDEEKCEEALDLVARDPSNDPDLDQELIDFYCKW